MLVWTRIRALAERHRAAITRTIFVLTAAVVVVGWLVDEVQDFLLDSGLLLLLVLALLTDLTITVSRLTSGDHRLTAVRDDRESHEQLLAQIRAHPPKQVDMLEFSGYSVQPLLEQLAHRGCRVRLLVRDPTCAKEIQRTRILASVRHVQDLISKRYGAEIEIRYYRAPPSVRGRKFDDKVVWLGWYTPSVGPDGDTDDNEVMGHHNPTVICSTASDEGQGLRDFFDRVFAALWETAVTTGHPATVTTGHPATAQAAPIPPGPPDETAPGVRPVGSTA
jgi:hypothetical protein